MCSECENNAVRFDRWDSFPLCVFNGPPFSQSCVLPCGCHSIECNRTLELISFGETMTDGRLDISHTDRCLDPAEHTQ